MKIYLKNILSIYIYIGVAIILLGNRIIENPKFTTFKYPDLYSDFTGFNVPFGIALIILGIVIIFIELTNKKIKAKDKYLVCPKCQTPYEKSKTQVPECPDCRIALEDLRGFHDRHPN